MLPASPGTSSVDPPIEEWQILPAPENDKVRDRQDSSRPGDLANSGGNEAERRTKPTKRMLRLTERVADRLVARSKIQPESFVLPQIGKPMVKRVIYQKVPGSCNRACPFRLGRNVATNQTEA